MGKNRSRVLRGASVSEEKPKRKKPPANYSARKWQNQENAPDRWTLGRPASKSLSSQILDNNAEQRMIRALDMKMHADKLVGILEKLDSGKLDVHGLFEGVSNQAAINLLSIAIGGDNERNRLDATKHLLALAGHNPAQKHQIERVDPNTPKEALLSMIAGSKKDLDRSGIEIVDDRDSDEDDEDGEN
jgi:hypothetical protein